MRITLLAVALAVAIALPAQALPPPVTPAADPTGGLLLRADDDGNMSLLLHVEDVAGGVVTHSRIQTQPLAPHLREMGTYTRAYAGHEGAPTVAVGVYAVTNATAGLALRVPIVLLENAATTDAATQALLGALNLALAQSDDALPFAQEILLPELAQHFSASPPTSRFGTFRDEPTLYVWTAHRGDAWSGAYLLREGSVTPGPDGNVRWARGLAELGAAARAGVETTRVAGAYLEEVYDGTPGAQRATLTSGAAAAGARTPLASLVLDDWRAGPSLADPEDQRTRATLGVHAPDGFVPLLGVETTQSVRPSQSGNDVTRVTSVGAFAPDYTPLGGARFHSDTADLLDTVFELTSAGPGSPTLGDFELDVGAFPEGEYVPVAGVVHRTHFREARSAYASLVALGTYTPLGFSPLAALSYDGSMPLVPWVNAMLAGEADGQEWLMAVGTIAAGTYVPAVGVEARGRAPLQERAEGYEARLGVFAGSYRAFVPLVSLAYDGDATPVDHALAFALRGLLGSESGAFDVRVGTYVPAELGGDYVGLAGAGLRDDAGTGWSNESMVVAGVYAQDTFVPLVGVRYQGDDTLQGSLRNLGNAEDDAESRTSVGVFVDGAFVPLVMLRNAGDGAAVVLAPEATA